MPSVQDEALQRASRIELARFLRARRARISPGPLGLPTSPRRRARGLLREEVAALAGVSTTWYTFLEQARPIRPSIEVVDRIADALQLDDDERSHLARLALGHATAHVASPGMSVDAPAAHALVRALGQGTHPVYCTTWCGDILAWNAAAADWYTDWSRVPAERRNIFWWFYTDPRAGDRVRDWADETGIIVARLRATYAMPEARPDIDRLVTRLSQVSEAFASAWTDHEVAAQRSRPRTMVHPRLGERTYRITVLMAADNRAQGYAVHVPVDPTDAGGG